MCTCTLSTILDFLFFLCRFAQHGRSLRNVRKNNHHVQFPLLLDLAPFCTTTNSEVMICWSQYMRLL